MDYENMSQENKVELLEQAVINGSGEEIAALFGGLGYVEMTARALGLACRFRGLDIVKVLVEGGATFDIPNDENVESRYHCYGGIKYGNYRSDFSLYLLNITKQIKGACCCKGLKPVKQVKRQDKTVLRQLPDSERAEILKYLCGNKDRVSFNPSEMLYYAIFARDGFIAAELKRLGVGLSDTRVHIITNGGPISDGYWYEWTSMLGKLTDEDFLPVMTGIAGELAAVATKQSTRCRLPKATGGKPFHCTGRVYDNIKCRFINAEIFEFFRDNFKTDKLNKTQIIRDLIDNNAAGALPCVERLGWLEPPKRRDELIEYARCQNRTECVAWLLDFKNRTADFAAEREKAEKKMLRELNANPNSVSELKKKWSYKNREDGTLIITNYKGTATEVTVPEVIGKGVVTAIGNGAFAGASGVGAGLVTANFTHTQMQARRHITRLTLPKTLKYIGDGAFTFLKSLNTIDIPDGVEEIGAFAFDECDSLTEITVPGSVKRIGKYAFAGCDNLRRVKTCEGVLEIGAGAFSNDLNLKEIVLPGSLKRLLTQNILGGTVGAFPAYLTFTVYCPKGSYAEEYCKRHNIRCICGENI